MTTLTVEEARNAFFEAFHQAQLKYTRAVTKAQIAFDKAKHVADQEVHQTLAPALELYWEALAAFEEATTQAKEKDVRP